MTWIFTDPLAALEAALKAGLDQAVDDTAADILLDAQANAPVLSGSLRDSGHVVSPRTSGYEQASSAARDANPGVKILPEFPSDDVEPDEGVSGAVVDFPAGHASIIHHGRYNADADQYQAGNPFLSDAIDAHENDLKKRAAKVLKKLGAIDVQ